MHKNKYLEKSVLDKEPFFDESSSPEKDDFLVKENFLKKQKSTIHGTGIFTTLAIPAHEPFYLVPLTDVRTQPTPRAARITTNKFVVDENVLNYVNHSCDANSELVFEPKRVILRAKRLIAVGEEITVDYVATEERNTLVNCTCGSPKCRNFFFTT